MKNRTDIRIRYLKKVGFPDSCWFWKGAKDQSGYGKLIYGSRKEGKRHFSSAHRISYETFYGKIPDGLRILHKCDNPQCTNPLHLYAGTLSQNTMDAVNRGRWNNQIEALKKRMKEHPMDLRGEKNPNYRHGRYVK